MKRAVAFVLAMLLLFAGPAVADVGVIEQLRLRVPTPHRELWLEAEARSWQPWLERQDGFLGRDLYWDPQRQEGVLLIRWSSREQWKSIPDQEVLRVQERFEAVVNQALDRDVEAPPLFPLLAEGELLVQMLPERR